MACWENGVVKLKHYTLSGTLLVPFLISSLPTFWLQPLLWQLCAVVTQQVLASIAPHNSCFLTWGFPEAIACRDQVSHSAPRTHWKWEWTKTPWGNDGSWGINIPPTPYYSGRHQGLILQGNSKHLRGMELQLPILVTSSMKCPWIASPPSLFKSAQSSTPVP